jgi:hypothetical protein
MILSDEVTEVTATLNTIDIVIGGVLLSNFHPPLDRNSETFIIGLNEIDKIIEEKTFRSRRATLGQAAPL